MYVNIYKPLQTLFLFVCFKKGGNPLLRGTGDKCGTPRKAMDKREKIILWSEEGTARKGQHR